VNVRIDWGSALHALVLVRLGQELGTDSTLARAVFSLGEIASKMACFFVVDKF
jgi:hypothetical protein